MKDACRMPGCSDDQVGRSLCMKHYKRWWRATEEGRDIEALRRPIADPLCNRFLSMARPGFQSGASPVVPGAGE